MDQNRLVYHGWKRNWNLSPSNGSYTPKKWVNLKLSKHFNHNHYFKHNHHFTNDILLDFTSHVNSLPMILDPEGIDSQLRQQQLTLLKVRGHFAPNHRFCIIHGEIYVTTVLSRMEDLSNPQGIVHNFTIGH